MSVELKLAAFVAPEIEQLTAVSSARLSYDRVTLPSDFPDPTIACIDGVYWVSATSAEWGGVFPQGLPV